MVDLVFMSTSEADFVIVAYSECGQQWLIESAYSISIESETTGCNTPMAVGKCWIETKAEFDRLYARAAAVGRGLTVLMKSADENR
jgi:hypothetical protein